MIFGSRRTGTAKLNLSIWRAKLPRTVHSIRFILTVLDQVFDSNNRAMECSWQKRPSATDFCQTPRGSVLVHRWVSPVVRPKTCDARDAMRSRCPETPERCSLGTQAGLGPTRRVSLPDLGQGPLLMQVRTAASVEVTQPTRHIGFSLSVFPRASVILNAVSLHIVSTTVEVHIC